jgi:hypothetical protein
MTSKPNPIESEPIPASWDAIVCHEFTYWQNLDTLEKQWERTQEFKESETVTYQEFLFWRRVSIVWACASIEAFINSEGVAWLGEGFYKDNIERLSVLQKIHTIWAFKYGKRLPRKLGRLVYVKQLFDLRNRIVHPKANEVSQKQNGTTDTISDIETMKFEHLRKVITTVTLLFEPDGVGETESCSDTKDICE